MEESQNRRKARLKRRRVKNRLQAWLMLVIMLVPFIKALASPTQMVNAVGNDYTTDNQGIYPTSNYSEGKTVLNYKGTDDDNYLKFGDDLSNPNYQIRKYAKETTRPGLFDVYLDVKGNTVQTKPKPIDVVLVDDMSGSMADSRRIDAVREGTKNFFTAIQASGLADYVNVGYVGYSSEPDYYYDKYYGGSDGITAIKIKPVSDFGQVTSINNELTKTPYGGTFTQKGIREAQNMLAADNSGHKKMMILLTDGVPTTSYKVTSAARDADGTIYGTEFSLAKDEPGNTSKLKRSYAVGSWINKISIRDTFAATIGEAKIVQNAGTEVHALAIQPSADGNLSSADVEAKMAKFASPGLYQRADYAGQITTYLKNQANDILSEFNTVNNGSISDPIGAQFSLVGTPTVTSPNSDATVAVNDGVINTQNLNIGADETATIHYQLRINTESAGFKPDTWYQMNGTTTLKPNDVDDSVDFIVPSAKAPATTITFQKNWESLAKDADLPESITVSVLRNGQAYQDLTLKASDNWQTTFSAPAYGNDGQAFNYTVSNEQGATNSYQLTQEFTENKLTLTNRQYGVQINKLGTDNNQALAGAKFNLISYDNANFTNTTTTDEITTANAKALAPGFYGIVETTAPNGYKLDGTEYLFQLTNEGKWLSYGSHIAGQQPAGTAITESQLLNAVADKQDLFTVTGNHDGNVLELTKYDEPKPKMNLIIVKQDNQGNYLADAKFSLNSDLLSKKEELSSTAEKAGIAFKNQLLANGQYTIAETKAPVGYQTNDQQVEIVVNDAGTAATVKVAGQEIASGKSKDGYAVKVDGQNITLTVTDQPIVILPHTGGNGILMYLAAGLIFMVLAGSLMVIRRKNSREVQ